MTYILACQEIHTVSKMHAGLTPASLLSWSPNGEYVLEGSIDGSFRIWECHKWTDAAWASQVLHHVQLTISLHQDWHAMHIMLGMLSAHRSLQWLQGCDAFMDVA